MELEAEIYDGASSRESLDRYRELKQRLTSSPSARVDEVSAHLRRIGEEITRGPKDEEE
ncbi:hypothetical protein [Streptomyces sp. NPDC001833]|uniref:hypothetical protein n=1 Tax=Streptomyces sp. NPDC001833 TaxID=3154658 RepID=UPI00332F08EE